MTPNNFDVDSTNAAPFWRIATFVSADGGSWTVDGWAEIAGGDDASTRFTVNAWAIDPETYEI